MQVPLAWNNHFSYRTFCDLTSRNGGVDLISDALPVGQLWCEGPNAASNAINYAKFRSRSHNAVIRVYDDADNVMLTYAWGQPPFALTPRNADRHGAGRASDPL